MSTHLIWDGGGAREFARGKAVAWLHAACVQTANRARELLSVAGTGRYRGRKVGPIERSRPGEPPRKQTGRLRASVTHEIDEKALVGRVGTNVEYGAALELGTRRGLAPRPWLRPALEWTRARLSNHP